MHQSSPPWRALDHPTDQAGLTAAGGAAATGGPEGPESVGRAGPGFTRWLLPGLIVGALALAALAAIFAFNAQGEPDSGLTFEQPVGLIGAVGSSSVSPGGSPPSPTADLVVDVTGAVRNPGVFRLPGGARVADAVAAAGGYGPRVDVARASASMNLAARLRDGEKVHVPSRDDRSPAVVPGDAATGGAGSGGSPTGPVDLNSASAAELEALPGVGPATAAKIIASRTQSPFASVDDLRTRKLVGAATFAKLRDLATVR